MDKVKAQIYNEKRRRLAKENGLCQNCCKAEIAPDKTCCFQCLDDKKLRQKFGSAEKFREVYGALFEQQGGRCAICEVYITRPVMDHCHKTMEVRGLLCSSCNTGLGFFKDEPDTLLNAVKYLRFSKTGFFFKKSPGLVRLPLARGFKENNQNNTLTKKGYLVID